MSAKVDGREDGTSERRVSAQMSSSSSDNDSKLRGPSHKNQSH
ncbi:hypothetical protein AVEN_121826-1, partial [Araneus ventricosus]